MGFNGIKIAQCVPEAWKLRIVRPGLDQIHFFGKQQDQVPVLFEFQKRKFLIVSSCQSMTRWWKVITPELLGHVFIPYIWTEFIIHKGCSYNCASILKSGLVAGGRASRDGRQNSFLHTSSPMLQDDPEEERQSDDFTTPRKAHYRSRWKLSQDAVYWVN